MLALHPVLKLVWPYGFIRRYRCRPIWHRRTPFCVAGKIRFATPRIEKQPCQQIFKLCGMLSGEKPRLVRINIQNSQQIIIAIKHRYHQFRLRRRRTGNMPVKLVHIINNLCLAIARRSAAYALVKRDQQTAMPALIRPQLEHPRHRHPVKPNPVKPVDRLI